MAYCAPRALPHSRFKAWEPLDQAKAMAWQLQENERCRECGQLHSDWHDDLGRPLRDPPFQLVRVLCQGCEMRAMEDGELEPGQKWAFRPWDDNVASSDVADDVSMVPE